jgi:hypothetical protein
VGSKKLDVLIGVIQQWSNQSPCFKSFLNFEKIPLEQTLILWRYLGSKRLCNELWQVSLLTLVMKGTNKCITYPDSMLNIGWGKDGKKLRDGHCEIGIAGRRVFQSRATLRLRLV